MPTEQAGLIKKLSEIMAEIDHVEKRGRNEFHKYAYVKAADLAHIVRDKLSAKNIIMLSDVVIRDRYTIAARDGDMQAVDVNVEYTLLDGETGASLKFKTPGTGTDKGDKAIYKALTGSLKYALRNTFLVPDESDPEADEETDAQTDFSNLHKKSIEHISTGCPVCRSYGLAKPWKVVETKGHVYLRGLDGNSPVHDFENKCHLYCASCKKDWEKLTDEERNKIMKIPAGVPSAENGAASSQGTAPPPTNGQVIQQGLLANAAAEKLDKPITPKQRKDLETLAAAIGWTEAELKQSIKRQFKVESLADVTVKDAEQVRAFINAGGRIVA